MVEENGVYEKLTTKSQKMPGIRFVPVLRKSREFVSLNCRKR